MTFQFRREDPTVADGVRRIAREELSALLAEIDDPDLDLEQTIHGVRKRCKKLRALLRLVAPVMKGAKKRERTIRDAARELSHLRDAHVRVATLKALAARKKSAIEDSDLEPAIAAVSGPVSGAAEEVAGEAALAAFRTVMADLLYDVDGWVLSADGPAAFRKGFVKPLVRGAQRLASLAATSADELDTERLHDLRKDVKTHWYHVSLLEPCWPKVLKAEGEELDRLGELLGDDHDLAVLEQSLRSPAHAPLDADRLDRLTGEIGRRRETLQRKAVTSAARVFAEDPVLVADRVGRLWEIWRRDRDEAAYDLAKDLAAVFSAERTGAFGTASTGGRDGATSGAAGGPGRSNREIERKFLVDGDRWREEVVATRSIRQGYLALSPSVSVRVRIEDGVRATITAKSGDAALERIELETEIPLAQAERLMASAIGEVVDKSRHLVQVGETEVTVDEFRSPRAGLVLAEVELTCAEERFDRPDWLGAEVTGDPAYYSAEIARGLH